MFGNRRERRGGLGLLLLLERLMSVGNVGPVTLLTIAGQVRSQEVMSAA